MLQISGSHGLVATTRPNLQQGCRKIAWHVAATVSRKENLALNNLDSQGFQTFLPKFRKPWRHARQQGVRLAPLFPGYVFIAFDRELSPWRAINGTFGVRHLLGSSVEPQSVPDDFMIPLLARCPDGVIDSLVDRLEPGAHVRIMSGPFADRLAVIDKLDDQQRVTLLLDIMGTAARLKMGRAQLAPG
jgi:transcriptional antiterminator RfaH